MVERRVAWILVGVIVAEGVWVVISLFPTPARLIAYLGFSPLGGTASGWIAGFAVACAYVAGCWSTFPSVREHLLRMGTLKALAVVAAVAAAILEEVVFRKWLMDWLDRRGFGDALQVLASGLAFGVGHLIWGFLGRSPAALHSAVATTVLGAALAIVYVTSDRSLAPCIAAHFAITALIEPGLMVAAFRGEMGMRKRG